MNEHTLLIKYMIGTGILSAYLLAAIGISIVKHRKHQWANSVILHIAQLGILLCAIALARHYGLMAIVDYHLGNWVTPRMINIAAVFAAVLTVFHSISMLFNRLEKSQIRKGKNPTSARIIARVMKFVSFTLILLFFGEHFGLSMSGLLTFGGIGGIAIAMASKDILSNVFSGTMLYFDRQFNIGDWIRSPDRNIEGTVVEIGWRLTKIMTFDHRPLYVPNSLFSSISIENPGQMTNRRIQTEIGLRYEDAGKMRDIVDSIRQMITKHPDIDHTQTTLINFNAFADSSLNIMVYCFTKTTNWAEWLNIQQDVYLKIVDIVEQHGADFAFPSQTVYLEKNT